MTLINTLDSFIVQLNRWVCPVILIFGILGNILNIILFTRHTFSKQSCSLYFLCIALINLAMYFIGLITRIIDDGWKLNLIYNTTTSYCKIRNYLVYSLFSISSWLFVLASLDRYFATSQSAAQRRFYCSSRMALKLILLIIGICLLAHTHMLIFYGYYLNLNGYNQWTLSCTTNSLAYSIFYALFILIFYSLLPPILMSIVSLLTINNFRKSRQRLNVLTILTLSKTVQARQDTNQLIRVLSLQIFILILFTIPHSIYWLYMAFTALENVTKSNLRREYEKLALNLVRILLYINYGSSFYVQIIISQTFRSEFVKFLKKISIHAF